MPLNSHQELADYYYSDQIIETLYKSKEINWEKALSTLLKSQNKLSFDRNKAIRKISDFYRNNRLVLVLGAGVSMDAKLPSWNQLLQELISIPIKKTANLDDGKSNVLSQLFNLVLSPNNLIEARYISNYFSNLEKDEGDTHLFEKAVKDILYKNFDDNCNSELLKQIVQFCVSPGKNPSLDSIITYNYDDLLEFHLQKLKKAGVNLPYISVYTIGQNPKTNQLPIYHVHGYLPRNGEISIINKLTLGDDSYHLQYNDVYKWSNLVQINKFKDYNCLFLGNSLTDPNQRRLLDIAKQQRGNDDIVHFLIKRRYKTEELKFKFETILSQNQSLLDEKARNNLELADTLKSIIDIIHRFETNDAHSFGIEMIWVDNYSDIPLILKDIETGIHK